MRNSNSGCIFVLSEGNEAGRKSKQKMTSIIVETTITTPKGPKFHSQTADFDSIESAIKGFKKKMNGRVVGNKVVGFVKGFMVSVSFTKSNA